MTAATVKSGSINSTAAISLTRRLLFPLNAGESLPPLLLSPSAAPDLNNELYDLIALALRAFVNPWWTKITRYDKEFLPDIARILTHVIRSLEARVLTATDIPNLLFRVIPTIVTQHYKDYRNAESKLSSSYATGGALSLPQLFHQLQPHMAVSANGTIEPEYYRQIVDHILKTSLPPEDYEPEAERLIIREIILKVLLQDVIPKVTQPWFIHMSILDLLGKTDGTPLLKVRALYVFIGAPVTSSQAARSSTALDAHSRSLEPLVSHSSRVYPLYDPIHLGVWPCPRPILQAHSQHHQARQRSSCSCSATPAAIRDERQTAAPY
jgi:hypothetical protein